MIDSASQQDIFSSSPPGSVVFFDGRSNRRRIVSLVLGDVLEIHENGTATLFWAYDDIRQADSPPGLLRVNCLNAPALARLDIRDAVTAAALSAHCRRLHENRQDGRATLRIVFWSIAAAISIVLIVL